MSRIEEVVNPRTGLVEVFLNGRRLEDMGDDRTAIEVEILKLIEDLPTGEGDEERNAILARIAMHLGNGNTSLVGIKDVLRDIYDKIGEGGGGGGSSEEIERVKRELLILINILDRRIEEIEESKLVAGEGIIIEGNVISTTQDTYIDKLIDDYMKLLKEYNKLHSRLVQLQSEMSVLQEKNTRLEQDNARVKRELREMTDRYDSAKSEITRLNEKIQCLEEEIASDENYKLYKKYERLYHQEQITSNSLREDLREAANKYDRAKSEIAKLNREIQRLEEIIVKKEDYKLYKKYEQLYQQAQREADKWRTEFEQLLRSKKNTTKIKTIVNHVDCLTGRPVTTTFIR